MSKFTAVKKPHTTTNGRVLVRLKERYGSLNQGEVSGFPVEEAKRIVEPDKGRGFGEYVAPTTKEKARLAGRTAVREAAESVTLARRLGATIGDVANQKAVIDEAKATLAKDALTDDPKTKTSTKDTK